MNNGLSGNVSAEADHSGGGGQGRQVRRLGGLHLVHQPPGGPGQGPGRPEGRAHRREDPGRRHHVDAGDRQGRRRRRPLHLALLALQRHRPQDHEEGHGLLQPHALLRAAPVLPGESGPCGRGDAPGQPHGRPRQLQLRPGRLPSGGHDGPGQVHHRGGQPEYALGLRPHRHRDQHSGRGLRGGGGQSPRGPAGRRR